MSFSLMDENPSKILRIYQLKFLQSAANVLLGMTSWVEAKMNKPAWMKKREDKSKQVQDL